MYFRNRGMTLVELLIAVVIVAIIAKLSIARFSTYILQSHRLDGTNTLISMSLAEEQYRTSNTQYGTLAQVWAGATSSPQGYYTMSISGISGTGYTLTATAVGNQANDAVGGTNCATLTFAMSSNVISKTPAACWPS